MREIYLEKIMNYVRLKNGIFIEKLSFNISFNNYGIVVFNDLYIFSDGTIRYTRDGIRFSNQRLDTKILVLIKAVLDFIGNNTGLSKKELSDNIIDFVKKEGGHIGFKEVLFDKDLKIIEVSVYSNGRIKYMLDNIIINEVLSDLLDNYLINMLTLIEENKFL